MPLTKKIACAALYNATLKSPIVQERYKSRAGVESAARHAANACLNNWKSPGKKKPNPDKAGCQKKTVTFIRKGGVVEKATLRHCGKKTGLPATIKVTGKGTKATRKRRASWRKGHGK